MPVSQTFPFDHMKACLRTGRLLTSITWASIIAACALFLSAMLSSEAYASLYLWRIPYFAAIAATTGLADYYVRLETRELWTEIYAGTKWLTPAGEIGTAIKANANGRSVELDFNDPFPVVIPVVMLSAVEHSPDKAALIAASGRLKLLRNRMRRRLFYACLAFDVVAGVFAFSCADPALPPAVAAAIALAISLWLFGWQFCFLVEPTRTGYPDKTLLEFSARRWRTNYGEIGSVRWVTITEQEGAADKVMIVLKLSNGIAARFNQKDLTVVEEPIVSSSLPATT
ncbi:hypothetical protein DTW90_08810 [Neorhizobium sp. P12A]|uniref:hypothetical protein n=1 Tax=Neorhizobium sp. P12A TaxID=2268027 RepID=UPI0011EE0748|nr:hypothetical protein [Neorhizobium sp. P12A]KAA0699475.1 hypothetical protein DTW90_08810 [Neorhizobium sp. P12A]